MPGCHIEQSNFKLKARAFVVPDSKLEDKAHVPKKQDCLFSAVLCLHNYTYDPETGEVFLKSFVNFQDSQDSAKFTKIMEYRKYLKEYLKMLFI